LAVDRQIKQRLVGAAVLVSLVVIFVPMLVEDEPVLEPGIHGSNIPPRPPELDDFPSGVLPRPDQELGPEPPAVSQESPPPPDEPASEPLSVVQALPAEPEANQASEPAAKPHAEPKPAAPAPVKPRVGISAWAVQVASFERRDNAVRLVERLRADNQDGFMEEVEIGKATWYRVRVGPELDRKKADRMLARIKQTLGAEGRSATVVRYP